MVISWGRLDESSGPGFGRGIDVPKPIRISRESGRHGPPHHLDVFQLTDVTALAFTFDIPPESWFGHFRRTGRDAGRYRSLTRVGVVHYF